MRWCRSGEMSTNKIHLVPIRETIWHKQLQIMVHNFYTMDPVKSSATDNP